MTDSTSDGATAGGVADEELLRLARKAWPDSEEDPPFNLKYGVSADEETHWIYCRLSDNTMYRLLDVVHEQRACAALHAALLVLAGEVDLQALLDARAAERADFVAWLRDRDTVGERSAEDIFTAAYNSTRKGMGLAEAIYRGMAAVSDAAERGCHEGAAAEGARRDG